MTVETVDLGEYNEGEIPPPFTYTFETSTGVPLDLNGFQGKFVFRQKGVDGVDPVERVAEVAADQSVDGGSRGQVTFVWANGDMTVGKWWGDLWVGDGEVRLASVRLVWKVHAAVAPAPAI